MRRLVPYLEELAQQVAVGEADLRALEACRLGGVAELRDDAACILVPVALDCAPQELTIRVVTPTRRQVPRKVQVFATALDAAMRDGPFHQLRRRATQGCG